MGHGTKCHSCAAAVAAALLWPALHCSTVQVLQGQPAVIKAAAAAALVHEAAVYLEVTNAKVGP